MSYRILIVEKARDEIPTGEIGDMYYSNLTMLLEAEREILIDEGYTVQCFRGLPALQ